MDKINLGDGTQGSGDSGLVGGGKINANYIALVEAMLGQTIWSNAASENLDLSTLNTTNKTSLKAAINELLERSKLIDDSLTTSVFKTWSVDKIKNYILLNAGGSDGGVQDTTNPLIAISAPSIVFEPFVATFTLSESVLNFTIDDIILIGGTKANFQINGLVATCDIDPTGVPYGNFSIIVQQNAFTDISGNPVSLSQLNINYVQNETTPPTLTISSPSTFVTAPFTVSFTFSEDITGFDVNDINLTGGYKSNFTVVSQNVFTVLITPVVLYF